MIYEFVMYVNNEREVVCHDDILTLMENECWDDMNSGLQEMMETGSFEFVGDEGDIIIVAIEPATEVKK